MKDPVKYFIIIDKIRPSLTAFDLKKGKLSSFWQKKIAVQESLIDRLKGCPDVMILFDMKEDRKLIPYARKYFKKDIDISIYEEAIGETEITVKCILNDIACFPSEGTEFPF
ncbi:MAG: hypothetical protein WCK92_08060 [Bacteroidota bacterium]